MSEVYSASAGGIQVLHVLATTPGRLTAAEVAGELDVSRERAATTLKKLYRAGYVTRVKRTGTGFGPNPYEYAVYQPEGDSA